MNKSGLENKYSIYFVFRRKSSLDKEYQLIKFNEDICGNNEECQGL